MHFAAIRPFLFMLELGSGEGVYSVYIHIEARMMIR